MQNYTWRFSTEWSLSSNGINWHLKGQRVTFRGVPRAAQRQCSKFRQRQGQIHATEWHIHVKWKTMLFDEIFSVFMVSILFLAPSIQTMRWTCIMVQSDSPQRLNVHFFLFFFSQFSVHRHTVRSVTLQYYFWPTDVWEMWQGGL